jgi:transaldolase/glucose-6-phosphate isomerase
VILTSFDTAVQATLARLDQQKFCQRLWERDASLWKREPEHQRVINNALGWLSVPLSMFEQVDEILKFVGEVRAAGFRHAVVLGMGGSSLCPDVCRATFGTAPGFLELQVLDSTVPASVARLEKSLDAARTLFLVSSKSGGTAETTSFYRYFYDRVGGFKGERAGENFVAITDPGTSLERLAQERRFRRVFHGQPDIGGRYSALSNFGMVPAALAGVDVRTLLASAADLVRLWSAGGPARDNPAVWLGVMMAEAARLGRDKITFVISPRIETFADWAEQLIAESTGKEGKGLVPVAGEALDEPAAYGNDRLFVNIKLASQTEDDIERKLQALEAAGHPVIRIELQDVLEFGHEFFCWEVATATAGALLGINPFDQPNVQESKDNTNRLLAQFRAEGKLAEDAPVVETEGIGFYGDAATRSSLEQMIKPRAMTDYLAAFLGQARPGNYVALLAYIEPSSEHKAWVESIRLRLRDSLHLATTVGFGPRYLHSTGQLHKGGAANGLFIQVTADDSADLPVPGEPYGFSVLKQAQALGDLQSLQGKGRRVVRLHLGKSVPAGLKRLAGVVGTALKEIIR